jgi:hypothetical protein
MGRLPQRVSAAAPELQRRSSGLLLHVTSLPGRHGSADVWAYPELFTLDAQGRPTQVSGYPPDSFCRQGQRWGHPQYAWAAPA